MSGKGIFPSTEHECLQVTQMTQDLVLTLLDLRKQQKIEGEVLYL